MTDKEITVSSIMVAPSIDDPLYDYKSRMYDGELNTSEGIESEQEFEWDEPNTEQGF